MILLGAGSPKELSSSMPGFHHVSPLHQSKIGYDSYFRKVFNKMLKSAMEYFAWFCWVSVISWFPHGLLGHFGKSVGIVFYDFYVFAATWANMREKLWACWELFLLQFQPTVSQWRLVSILAGLQRKMAHHPLQLLTEETPKTDIISKTQSVQHV